MINDDIVSLLDPSVANASEFPVAPPPNPSAENVTEPLIRKMVQKNLFRVGVKHGSNWWLNQGGKRLAIYARNAIRAGWWTNQEHEEVRREALRNGVPGNKPIESVLSLAIDNTKKENGK